VQDRPSSCEDANAADGDRGALSPSADDEADKPDIFNTDQGSQFTGTAFTGVLIKNEIAISMDVEGAWRTTSSSSGCRAASNTRRCIREPMTPSAKLALRSVVT
jgi:hypothetical protein